MRSQHPVIEACLRFELHRVEPGPTEKENLGMGLSNCVIRSEKRV